MSTSESVGLSCPKCKKGKLKLSGLIEWQEDQASKAFHGFREHECDNCGQKFKEHVITLTETVTPSGRPIRYR